MTYATKPFNLCQIGRESVAGTAVPATTIWRGLFGGFNDERTRETAEEDVGVLAPSERTYDTMLGVTAPMPETPLTFEQVLHLLEAGVQTATPTGAGPYVYVYSYSLADTPNPIRTYTLRLGNRIAAADVRNISYALVQEMTFAGKQGEAWMMQGTWMAPRAVAGTFTASLALPAVEQAIFANTIFYLDNSGGTIGTTQKIGVLMDAEVKIEPGLTWVPVGDGNLYATAHKHGRPRVSFTISYELQQVAGVSLVAVERAAYEANALRLIRLRCAGSAGRYFQLDMAGRYDNVSEYKTEGENNVVVTFEGHCDYSAADALFFTATVANGLATVP